MGYGELGWYVPLHVGFIPNGNRRWGLDSCDAQRWGGKRRLSGFLPMQSFYADFYIRNEFWPDFELRHFDDALSWFKRQDGTFGG